MNQGELVCEKAATDPFAIPGIMVTHKAWYETTGRRADRLEESLQNRLWTSHPQVGTLLEVGCGTGHSSRSSGEQGLQAVGIDLSLPMLADAVRLDGPLREPLTWSPWSQRWSFSPEGERA